MQENGNTSVLGPVRNFYGDRTRKERKREEWLSKAPFPRRGFEGNRRYGGHIDFKSDVREGVVAAVAL